MLKNQERRSFVSMGEFTSKLALEHTYNLGDGGIFSCTLGLETFRRSFYLEFRNFFNEMD